jgi:hypothetical protein
MGLTTDAEEPDDTAASTQGGDAPTVIHETTAAPEVTLAYSDEDKTDDFDQAARHSWRAAWSRAAFVVVGGVLVAGIIGGALWGWTKINNDHQAKPQIAPTSAAAPPPSSVAPPPPNPDQQFLSLLRQLGLIHDAPQNSVTAPWNGHMVCTQLGEGVPFRQIVNELQAAGFANPADATFEKSRQFAVAAVASYCPQYQSQVE